MAEVQAWKECAANTFLMENSPYSLLEVSLQPARHKTLIAKRREHAVPRSRGRTVAGLCAVTYFFQQSQGDSRELLVKQPFRVFWVPRGQRVVLGKNCHRHSSAGWGFWPWPWPWSAPGTWAWRRPLGSTALARRVPLEAAAGHMGCLWQHGPHFCLPCGHTWHQSQPSVRGPPRFRPARAEQRVQGQAAWYGGLFDAAKFSSCPLLAPEVCFTSGRAVSHFRCCVLDATSAFWDRRGSRGS